jgi:hypothetical protein
VLRPLLVLLACAALAATAASAAGESAPVPGTWRGTWRNTDTEQTGAVLLATKRVGSKLVVTVDFGTVFRCGPAKETATLTRGSGTNHWNATSFVFKPKSKAFGGDVTFVYTAPLQFSGTSGYGKGCAKWRLTGTFRGAQYNGRMIVTPSSGVAFPVLVHLTRS